MGFGCWNLCRTLKTMNDQNFGSGRRVLFQRHPYSRNNCNGVLSLMEICNSWGSLTRKDVVPILYKWQNLWWWTCDRGLLGCPLCCRYSLFEQTFPGRGCSYRTGYSFLDVRVRNASLVAKLPWLGLKDLLYEPSVVQYKRYAEWRSFWRKGTDSYFELGRKKVSGWG